MGNQALHRKKTHLWGSRQAKSGACGEMGANFDRAACEKPVDNFDKDSAEKKSRVAAEEARANVGGEIRGNLYADAD